MSRVLVKPELLAPAGNMEKGKMALLYGADAIYLGGKAFSLRAFSGNFSMEEIEEGLQAAGMELIEVMDGYSFDAPHEESERLLFAARLR